MLFDLTESKLGKVIAKLKPLKAAPTTVRDLRQLMADSVSFPPHQHINVFFYFWHWYFGKNNFWNDGIFDKKIFCIEKEKC